jgi:serine/threonine-protein kinase
VLSPGALFSDRYRLTDHLATGGMGEVWRAVDTVLGRTIAVKVLLPALLAEPGFRARFEAEARMMAALRHPGIVSVFDYGESDLPNGARAAYLVMEYVDGESLAARLRRERRLDPATTMAIVAEAAEALHAAHLAGIVHRDVKPGNLLVQSDRTVRLVDFGVARSVADAGLTGPNHIVGTALYMAPEQAAGRQVSPATDIYALGAVAYHCLAGNPPFGGGNALDVAIKHLDDDVPALPPDIAPPVAALVTTALAKDPTDRFATAEALAAAARAALKQPADPAATTVLAGPAAPVAAASPATAKAASAAAAAKDADEPPPRRRVPVAALSVAGLVAAAALAALLAVSTNADPPDGGGSGPAPTDQRSGAPAGSGTAGADGPTTNPGGSGAPTRSTAPGGSASPAPGTSPGTTATPGGTRNSSAPAAQSASPEPQPSAPASPNSDETGQSPEPGPTASGVPAGGGGGASPPPAADATSPPDNDAGEPAGGTGGTEILAQATG